MSIRTLLTSIFAFALTLSMADLAEAQGEQIVQSGHSLTDGVMTPMSAFVNAAGPAGTAITKSTIPGSPMEWRWNNPPSYDPNLRDPDVMSRFDVLVITERVPLANTMPWHDSEGWGERWCSHAWQHGADGDGARCVLYASWVGLDDPDNGPFLDRLEADRKLWKRLHDHMNATRPKGAPAIPMIPGPDLMKTAYQDISKGRAPGFKHIDDLFSDDIHLNAHGNYLIALAHDAVVFGRDPRSIPFVAIPDGPSSTQADWMARVVYDVLRDR